MAESQKTKWLIEWEAEDTDRPFANWMIEKAEALEAEVGRLETKVEEWRRSFALYDDAMRRGTKLWQEESGHPEAPRIWPDGAKLVAWLMARLDAASTKDSPSVTSGVASAENRSAEPEKLSQQIDGACIARMLNQFSKVRDGELHLWKHLAIALEADLCQALERESRLEFALLEAGLEVGEPWHANTVGEKGSRR